MSTFLAWLIANLRYAFITLFLLIAAVGISYSGVDVLFAFDGVGWMYLVCIGLFGCVDVPAIGERIVGFIVYLFAAILSAIFAENFRTAIIVATTVYMAISIIVARTARNHFEEIVSRRMNFRNSNADMFDIKWKYCFDRFFCTFKMLLYLTAEVFFLSFSSMEIHINTV